jgi:Spy/CpxP family protein refolding chaperone
MKWKASVLVIAVFLLGLVVGGLGVHVMGRSAAAPPAPPPPARTTEEVVKQLDAQCSLTADQKKQIGAIMDDVMAHYREVYETIRPQVEQARQDGRQRMRAVLTPEQLPKFEEFLRQMDEEKKKQEHK